MDINDAHSLATTLIQHHLGASSGWKFQFDRAERTFGVCHYNKRLITLSQPLTLINTEERVTNTILHEIAHALAGNNAGHGPAWKAECRKIGANPVRLSAGATLPPKYMGICPNGHETLKNRRNSSACGRCCRAHNGGKYSAEFTFTWQDNPLRTGVVA